MKQSLEERKAIIQRRRKCPICKSPVIGRSDKRFCSVSCKTDYNRRLRAATESVTIDIDKILHRNRSILLEIMGKTVAKKKIPRIELEKRNFNFNPNYALGIVMRSSNAIKASALRLF